MAEFEMSFTEIERALSAMLPKSANRPQWWANVTDTDGTHVQREAYRFLIEGRDRVKFRRTGR